MLRSGNQIRLTTRERRQLTLMTGASPDRIKTYTQLEGFIQVQRQHYPGRSPEETLMRRLLDGFL